MSEEFDDSHSVSSTPSESDESDGSLFEDATSVDDDVDLTPSIEGDVPIEKGDSQLTKGDARRKYPSPVSWLFARETDTMVVDFAVEAYINGDTSAYSERSLAKEIGISRSSVNRHIEKYVAIGMFETVETDYYTKYRVADTPVMRAIILLHETILDAYPDPKDVDDLNQYRN